MRVSFILPPVDMSGGNRVVAAHALHLSRRGHRVTVVSAAPEPLPWHRQLREALRGRLQPASHFDGLPIEHHRLPHTGPITDADVPDSDVVVATWWQTAEWVADLSPSKGRKVHLVQDWEVWNGDRQRVENVLRSPMPKIVVSEYLGHLLAKRFGRSAVSVVPNAVDVETFRPLEVGPPPGPACVGFAYSGRPSKGADVCLEAFRLAAKDRPGLRLLAIGNEKPTPDVSAHVSRYWHAARDRTLAGVYGRCRAWLFGSRREGFGLPVLEAMACGVPVVATPAGAAPQLLANGGGFLVPPDSPEEMAETLLTIVDADAGQWRKWSTAGRAAAADWTWDDASERFEQALATVVARPLLAV